MKPKDQITALAELDGWKQKLFDPPYLTSRDAIVPVILKWCGSDLSKWQKLSDKLFGWPDSETMYVTKAIRELLNRTPDQLCAAVLLAAGKWKEINYE